MKCLSLLFILILVFQSGAVSAEDSAASSGRVRVQLVSRHQTTLSSEISAQIQKLPLREGENFSEGQSLIVFDCSLYEAQLKKAEASAESARLAAQVSKRLSELGSIGKLEMDQVETRVKETEAEAAAGRVLVSKCDLKAPFPGRIAKLLVDPFQYVTSGKPLMDILDTSDIEVRLIVPSRWLSWLRAGTRFNIRIEELNRTVSAKVTQVGARIDPLSQSIQLTGRIAGEHPELLPGMSGWASFGVR